MSRKSNGQKQQPLEEQSGNQPPKEYRDELLEITRHARAEVEWVRSAYTWVVGLASAVVTIGIGIGIYFTHNSAKEFTDRVIHDGEQAREQQKAEFDDLTRKLTADVQKEAERIRQTIAKRIDDEFDSKQIALTVQKKAEERIDVIADTIIKRSITNQIEPLREEFKQLSASRDAIQVSLEKLQQDSKQSFASQQELKETIRQAREVLAFIMTSRAAANDDRAAFETLQSWGNDESYFLQKEARTTAEGITASYFQTDFNPKPYKALSWKTNVQPDALTYGEIKKVWKTISPEFVPAFVEFVGGNTNITKTQKLEFLDSVVSASHNSLHGADRAAHLLAKELGINYNPPLKFLAIQTEYTKWAQTNSAMANTDKLSP